MFGTLAEQVGARPVLIGSLIAFGSYGFFKNVGYTAGPLLAAATAALSATVPGDQRDAELQN